MCVICFFERGKMKISKNNQGFTLMELMIVVAVIAILVAIAMPNYQRSVIRSNRVAV